MARSGRRLAVWLVALALTACGDGAADTTTTPATGPEPSTTSTSAPPAPTSTTSGATTSVASTSTTPSAPTTVVTTPTTLPAPPTTSTTTTTTGPDSVVAEFQTPDGDRYRARLTGEAAATARAAFALGESPGIPNGLLQPGDGGVNLGHGWHVTGVEFADMTIEVCDGTVSYLDDLGYEGFVAQHGDRFCPWGAVLVGLSEG